MYAWSQVPSRVGGYAWSHMPSSSGDEYAWSRVLSGGVGIVGPRSLLGTSEGTPWKVHPLPGKVHLDKVHLLEGTPTGTDI